MDNTIESLFQELRNTFQKTLDWLFKEVSSMRGSKVRVNLIDGIKVDYYGSLTPLKEVASLSLLDSQTIAIEPWDKSSIPDIEKALYKTEFGGGVKNEGNRILFNLPMSTEEDRGKIVKIVKQKMEEAKESLRQSRDNVWKKVQGMERNSEISEDEKFKGKEKIEKLIKEFEEKIEEIEKRKEEEINNI